MLVNGNRLALIIYPDIDYFSGADDLLFPAVEEKSSGLNRQGYRTCADLNGFAEKPDMITCFYRFFEEHIIHFQSDHVRGGAEITGQGGAGFVQPGEHGSAKEVSMNADLAGLTYFRGYVLHLNLSSV